MTGSGIQCGVDGTEAAFRDPLTGLPNWMTLRNRLTGEVGANNGKVALVIVSLNRFREINNILGPTVGDQVLQRVAQRLRTGLPAEFLVARMGGDEFGIILSGEAAEIAAQWGTRIHGWLLRPFDLSIDSGEEEGIHLDIDVGIGVALYPDHGEDADELIRKTGVAVQLAKHRHDRLQVYEAGMDRRDSDRLLLAGQLRRAIAEDALEVMYQPIVELSAPKLVGVECLVRWMHPERGPVPAEQIIPVAEQTGLVRLLDYWMMDQAMQQQLRWRRQGIGLVVSVNLSARTFDDAQLQKSVIESIDRWELPPDCLCMEITESVLMGNPELAVEQLAALADSGVSFALDDYGTGYSSLAYLKRLPLSTLKIDRSFVADMASDDNDAVIVRSTIELAHNMGLKVVAEGVPDETTLRMLKALGCDRVQGHYVSKPLSEQDFSEWLSRGPYETN